MKTIADVKAANQDAGHHFFERSTMRFFNSKVESALYNGRHFITSERMELSWPKKYTIRVVSDDGKVETYGKFQAYSSIDAAREDARNLTRGLEPIWQGA